MLKEVDVKSIRPQWLTIKNKFKSGKYDKEEIDFLTCDLLAQLGALTAKGVTTIGKLDIDTYKFRVWNVVENAGLLPEYRAPKGEDDEEEITDEWEKIEEDDIYSIDEEEFYKQLTKTKKK